MTDGPLPKKNYHFTTPRPYG
ncbi:hypothetical protein EYZ11_011470 [Aspergillus tanneri]|uniref:Uncharacterized protein n=1 Tax=Aspergillus tanneri TaxID=1220188 RepID=A0A4S3J814_9EURO|nr:hypothetical protein EYZ11_011470 [Aspergillus tanneri]